MFYYLFGWNGLYIFEINNLTLVLHVNVAKTQNKIFSFSFFKECGIMPFFFSFLSCRVAPLLHQVCSILLMGIMDIYSQSSHFWNISLILVRVSQLWNSSEWVCCYQTLTFKYGFTDYLLGFLRALELSLWTLEALDLIFSLL